MSLARFSIRQVVLVNLLFVVFIIAGVTVYSLLPVDVYPDVSLDLATIRTPWPGASAEDVERLVTRVIEDEIEDVPGQERLYSYSLPDLSGIGVKFREDLSAADLEKAFDELRLAVDRVVDLPEGCEEPELNRVTVDEIWPLVQVVVVDEGAGEATVRRVALDLKDEIKLIPGVSRVREVAVREREVHLLLEEALLEKHGLSLGDVAAAMEARNLNVPAGLLETAGEEVTLRSVGEVDDPQQLGEVCIVRSPTGGHVRLKDVARIIQDFEQAVWAARFDGRPCALLYVSKERSANAITVRDAVAACLDRFAARHELPGVRLDLTGDSTTVIASRLNILKRNLALGLILVFVVLCGILGLRNSLLAIVGVPFSFLCAFLFLYGIGVSINAVSVFSLVLVSGIIVDDAIVVMENIYRHVQEGRPLRQAVVTGTDEVMWPVISSTLTTVAAFLPLLLMPGVLGRFFAIIPKTVAVALAASLFECLLILPAHYLDWGQRRRLPPAGSAAGAPPPKPGTLRRWRAVVGGRLLAGYDALLHHVLAHRYLAIGVVAALAVLTWQASRTLVRDLFPSDFPTFVIDFNARPGAGLEETDRVAARLYPILDSFLPDRVARYATALGVQWNEDNQQLLRTNLVQMWVDVQQGERRSTDPQVVMDEVRADLLAYVRGHPACGIENLRVWPVRDGPPVGKPVAIRVEHPDYAVAGEVAERIKTRLRSIRGVRDVADNLHLGGQELQMHLREQRAAELGVSYAQVATAFRAANDGLEVGVFKDLEQGDDLDIKIRLADEHLAALDDLLDVDVSGSGGRRVKLHQVADFRFERSYAARYHFNGRRAVQVTADVDAEAGADATAVTRTVLDEFEPLARRDPLLRIRAEGQYVETTRSFEALWRSGLVALGLMYLVLAAQFRSYAQPVVVLLAVVFGLVGMILGLVVCGYPFTIVTAVAMVGLCGVVVNDALVLLDFINTERRSGTPVDEALRVSCRRRARPIVLTTITTVFGLAPMALGVGGYSKIWSPFAMSMCWGLALATGLTLVLVPAFYRILADAQVLGSGDRLASSEEGPATR